MVFLNCFIGILSISIFELWWKEDNTMKHINIRIGLFFCLFLVIPIVNASLLNSGDITFSVDQKDYYFKTGEDAIIPLNVKNTYGEKIDGMLTYTYIQQINQGGMHMSTSNSQSTSFSVEDGENTQGLNFGTSDNPSELDISLKFVYTKKESRVVNLDGIKIHFVSDEKQKQSKQDKQSSSSKKNTQAQQSQNSKQDPFSQQEQQMQQMMNQMFGNQQPQQQSAEQRLQNNQMSQDSSALKQQMQNQLQEQQAMKKEFQKHLSQNQDFQKEHQSLLNQGYNLTGGNLNPSSNNTGDFELNYQNQKGEQASLKGHLQDGELNNLQKDTPETRQKMMQKLQKNKQFQKYNQQLQNQGFRQQNSDFSQEGNKTSVQVNYLNQKNETAAIKADIINDTVKDVELINENEKEHKNYWWILLVLLLLGIVGYFIYKKFSKKPKEVIIEKKIIEKPFDYKAESLKMLSKAKELFNKEQYKEAYMIAAQSLRLYLSYKNDLKKEITNDEIIKHLRMHKKPFKDAKECFDLCSLVEFAKYKANKKDFDKIIDYTKKIIE